MKITDIKVLKEGTLSVDVPTEAWLQEKIDYARSQGRNSYGVPYMGSTTAHVRGTPPRVRVMRLASLPGMRNEQTNVRKDDLKWLMDYMDKNKRLPPMGSNPDEEYLPYIAVAYNGEAWVNEGNHRIMAAYRLNWPDMPIEIRYFDGGERVRDGAMYPGKIGLGEVDVPSTESVAEVFEPGKQNWKWRRQSSDEAFASFLVGDREYQWHAFSSEANPAKWEIQFRLMRVPADPDGLDLFGQTGTGNSAEVLSTAVDITRAFLQAYGLDKVEEITFNAKEDSRINLYAKMIRRLLPTWHLSSTKSPSHGMQFTLTDPGAYDKPENKVTEAFDQPYRLRWEGGDYGDVDAIAKMDDGNYLSIMFNKGFSQETKEEAWSVEFYRNNSQEVTGEGDAQRVFATVLSAIQTFIKKYKPNKVYFSASKEVEQGQNAQSRARLYDSLVQRYARSWGFRAFRADTGNKVMYELSRIKPLPKTVAKQAVEPEAVTEARVNPEQNTRPQSGMKELQAVAKTLGDIKNWAISMTAEPKLGINPQVGISEDTPKGIYFYPLDYAVSMIQRRQPLPWGNNLPYIQLFQYDRSGEMTKETTVDSDKLKQALRQYCSEEVIQSAIDEPEYDGTPYWFIYDCLSRLGKNDETNIVRWNKVLRDLGFTSVFDSGGGWIAYNEPTQGVVLDPRIIKQLRTIDNKKESRVVTPAVIEQAIFGTLDIELAADRAWQAYDPDGSKLRQAAKEYAKKPEFKPWFGKPGTEEIFDKAASWGRYGARQLSQESWEWYKEQQAQKSTAESVDENFADGRNPQDKGDSQRHGIPKGATMAELEKAAKASGRKGQLARWQLNMRRGQKRANESTVVEGGWASVETQNTVITPRTIAEIIHILAGFEASYNVWQARNELDAEIKIGKPKGSGTYYRRDLEQDPEREYGDVDVECFIHSREGVKSAQRITEYRRAINDYCAQSPDFFTDNGTNIIMRTTAGPAQVDLIYTYHEHADWSRVLSPEYRVKGVISTSLTSSVAEALNLSFSSQGIQVKIRNNQPVSFRQSKDTELRTVSINPDNWAQDIYSLYYYLSHGEKPAEMPRDLQAHGGLKDEQRLSDIVLSIKALATGLEQANLLAHGALIDIADKKDLIRRVAQIYSAKLDTAEMSSKFNKASTPAAVEKAKKTKLMLAKYRNEVTKLLLN